MLRDGLRFSYLGMFFIIFDFVVVLLCIYRVYFILMYSCIFIEVHSCILYFMVVLSYIGI